MMLSAPSVAVTSEFPGVSKPVAISEDFGRDLAGRAIARYRLAIRSAREANAQGSKWAALTNYEVKAAERFLALAILASDPACDDPEMAIFDEGPARAIRADGRLFIAGPLPNCHKDDQMVLTVLDEGAVIDLDAIRSDVQGEPAAVETGLTDAQKHALFFIKNIGERECFDRLYMFGAYEVTSDAIRRLGLDAVAELRRQIEAGRRFGLQDPASPDQAILGQPPM
jgi:hypothetical protein